MFIYYNNNIYVTMSNQIINQKVNKYNKNIISLLQKYDIITEYNYIVSKSIKERYVHLRNQMIYVLVNSINHQSTFRNDQIEVLKSLKTVVRYDSITNKWIISF